MYESLCYHPSLGYKGNKDMGALPLRSLPSRWEGREAVSKCLSPKMRFLLWVGDGIIFSVLVLPLENIKTIHLRHSVCVAPLHCMARLTLLSPGLKCLLPSLASSFTLCSVTLQTLGSSLTPGFSAILYPFGVPGYLDENLEEDTPTWDTLSAEPHPTPWFSLFLPFATSKVRRMGLQMYAIP